MADARRLTTHATLVALVIGGLVLAGGIALIVVLGRSGGSGHDTGDRAAGARVSGSAASPSTSSTRPSHASVPTSTAAPTSASSTPTATKPTARKPARPVVYTVKPGDNLTVIAAWFHQHGYVDLYQRNRKVIGDNPNLILPGQRIVIGAGGRMTLAK